VQITDVAGRIGGGVTNGDSTGFALQGDPGEAFVKSEGYRKIADPATRGQRWSTGAVPLPNWSTKAGTVLESGQGAGLVPVPQVLPGVVETLFQPIEVTDLFATVQATSSSVRYAVAALTQQPGPHIRSASPRLTRRCVECVSPYCTAACWSRSRTTPVRVTSPTRR
jgi:hypothetical protein